MSNGPGEGTGEGKDVNPTTIRADLDEILGDCSYVEWGNSRVVKDSKDDRIAVSVIFGDEKVHTMIVEAEGKINYALYTNNSGWVAKSSLPIDFGTLIRDKLAAVRGRAV